MTDSNNARDRPSVLRRIVGELRYALVETVRALAWLSALVSAGAGTAGLLGAFSPSLDIASHGAYLWLALGLGSALVGGALEKRRFKWPLALGLVGAVSAAILMTPELLAARPAAAPASGERLKIVQLNLWGSNPDLARTARWIEAEDADVVLLEEAADSPILPMLKARYPHQITCAHPYGCAPMILLKQAPVAHNGTSTPPDGNLNWVTLGGPGGFTIAAIHLVKPWDPVQRRQIGLMAQRLAAFDQDTLVVGGDFNATPWSWSMRRQDRAFGLERRTRALATWPAWTPLPLLPIDHVYAGKAWRTVEVRRGPDVGSDHYPVVAVLERAP